MSSRAKLQNIFRITFKPSRRFFSQESNETGNPPKVEDERSVHFYNLDDKQIGKLFGPFLPAVDKDPATSFRYGISMISQLTNYKCLVPESIIGWTNSPKPEAVHLDFREQAAFVKFLHETVAKYVDNYEKCEYLRIKAKLFKSGWMHIEDERALVPLGRTPDPDDIFGYCLIRDGKIISGSYQAMPTHRLFSHLGEFRLPQPIYRFVLAKLIERLVQANTSKNEA
jgi:hypothetical protein